MVFVAELKIDVFSDYSEPQYTTRHGTSVKI